MKKKILLILSLVLIVNYSASAQGFCGTSSINLSTGSPIGGGGNPNPDPDPSPIPPDILDYFADQTIALDGISAEKQLCLNVFFHIVRDDNGNDPLPVNVDDIIDVLNNDYNPYKISFKKLGEGFIDDSRYLDLNDSAWRRAIHNKNARANVINIYLVRSAGKFLGEANSTPSNSFYILKRVAVSSTSSHEMGHCLGLYHTHETKFGIEEVNKCNTTGDLMCDTPPDSKLRDEDSSGNTIHYTDMSCNYIKGDGYNPDTRNMMSYARDECLERFSYSQVYQMRYNIQHITGLQKILNCECSSPFLLGKSTLCQGETATYTFPCINVSNPSLVDVNISGGLAGSAYTSTSLDVLVLATSTQMEGAEFIELTFDDIKYTKEIWVGKPQVKIISSVNITNDKVLLQLSGKDGTDIMRQNITFIKWETVSADAGVSITEPAINQATNTAVFDYPGSGSLVWKILIKVTVGNDCGETIIYKEVNPTILPCNPYPILRTSQTEYAVFESTVWTPIDPCPDANAKMEKVKSEDINRAILFDSFGNQIREYTSNAFNVENIQAGIYIFKIQVKNELITHKIIIE